MNEWFSNVKRKKPSLLSSPSSVDVTLDA